MNIRNAIAMIGHIREYIVENQADHEYAEPIDMAIEALKKQIKRESLDCGGLKPCPFCGGEAFGKPEGDYWEITCEECGCAKQGRDHDSARCEWNRRNP